MVTFKKYNSIENHFDEEFMEKLRLEVPEDTVYCVQEKVHGANSSFLCDGVECSFGKRTSVVEAGEQFYNYEQLLERYRPNVFKLFELIRADYSDVQSIIAYGELFGGCYPHKEVKPDRTVAAVQKGVFYCPGHDFYGFDIYVYTPDLAFYLPVAEVDTYYGKAGFLYAETLFKGTLNECLAWDNAFQSTISGMLGLPPIEDNICEGVVIKPEQPMFLSNGSRVIIKSKNARFAERKSVKRRPLEARPGLSEAVVALLQQAEAYLTEARIDNVRSHLGTVYMPKDLGKLVSAFAKDVQEDFMKEHHEAYDFLSKEDAKVFSKTLTHQCFDYVKSVIFRPIAQE